MFLCAIYELLIRQLYYCSRMQVRIRGGGRGGGGGGSGKNCLRGRDNYSAIRVVDEVVEGASSARISEAEKT